MLVIQLMLMLIQLLLLSLSLFFVVVVVVVDLLDDGGTDVDADEDGGDKDGVAVAGLV